MALKYKFRYLFYGKKFHDDRLYKTLQDLDERITALEEGNNTLQDLDERITALEEANNTSEPSTTQSEP